MTDLIPTEVEEIVMGQVLIDYRVISQAARMLKPEHFGSPHCRHAFEASLALWREGTGVDLLTVTNELRRKSLLERVGGPAALVGWTAKVASPRHFEDHATIVREHYGMRVLRETGENLMRGTVPGEDPVTLMAPVTDGLAKASMSDVNADVNAGTRAFEMMNTDDRPKPIYLGMDSVDGMVFILPGNVVTIRAAAGVGKSAFVLSAVSNLLPVRKPWIVSLEMPADELINRLLCQLALVDMDRVMEGRMSDAERERMAKAASDHAEMIGRLDIHDSGTMTIDEFMARAEHKVTAEGVGLIVIDYAQLMEADRKLYPSTVLQLEAISKGIRATGRKLEVPILVIVHVNKDGEDHGSSQFEKDAHVRIGLSRQPGAPIMDVDVIKNRNGRVGPITTPCEMRYGIVGRTGSPAWSLVPAFNPRAGIMPHPDNWTEPNKDADEPF